jgi:hypothetical protein
MARPEAGRVRERLGQASSRRAKTKGFQKLGIGEQILGLVLDDDPPSFHNVNPMRYAQRRLHILLDEQDADAQRGDARDGLESFSNHDWR